MIEQLKKNIRAEIEILREISAYIQRMNSAEEQERILINNTIEGLKGSLRILNNTIPSLVDEIKITPINVVQKKENEKKFEEVVIKRQGSVLRVVLSSKEKEQFFKELNISENSVKRLKKKQKEREEKFEEFKAARGYLKISNKYFLELANKYIEKGKFNSLKIELRKANIDVLFESYVAMMFFTTFVSFFVGLGIGIFLLFFSVGLTPPYLSTFEGNIITRASQVLWIPLALPVLVFFVLYYYPSTEKSSLRARIDQEIPFAVIHMSAISGSGIEPTQIFKIIGMNKDYPYLRKEFRKILNQINLYGYDLVTALNNAAKSSPSDRLSELLAGISTTVTSGARLTDFFEKRAESLLMFYRLEREKYTKVAETFMDIYISVVIAGPMIFLLLLILMSIISAGSGMTPNMIGILMVLIVAGMNVGFLLFLHLKQPAY